MGNGGRRGLAKSGEEITRDHRRLTQSAPPFERYAPAARDICHRVIAFEGAPTAPGIIEGYEPSCATSRGSVLDA
jgi:hypothetical protein